MRIRETTFAAGLFAAAAALMAPREAHAQAAPNRDATWGVVSDVTMVASAAIVTLMPRVYFNDPESTVGWKGRWHLSVLAPVMTMTAATLLLDGPIKAAAKSPRPGCGDTLTVGTTCDTFGGPSTHAFAAWGATGAGTGIFLVDALKYSRGSFNAPAFVFDVALPLSLSVVSSVGRAVDLGGGTRAFESPAQVVTGAATGLLVGLVVGGGYALFQHPACPYGNGIICW